MGVGHQNENQHAAWITTLKRKLAKNGIEMDEDACMYSCRHTYAKRTLQGYWTGQPTNIETLSQLTRNSRDVCWAQWCDTYTEPLWKSAQADLCVPKLNTPPTKGL